MADCFHLSWGNLLIGITCLELIVWLDSPVMREIGRKLITESHLFWGFFTRHTHRWTLHRHIYTTLCVLYVYLPTCLISVSKSTEKNIQETLKFALSIVVYLQVITPRFSCLTQKLTSSASKRNTIQIIISSFPMGKKILYIDGSCKENILALSNLKEGF